MQALPKSRLLRFVEQAYHLAQRAVGRYSSKFSKRRYTLHQHIVLLCLKMRKNTTYRTLLDEPFRTTVRSVMALARSETLSRKSGMSHDGQPTASGTQQAKSQTRAC
ncbi:hypothetical protein AUR64_04140 [Haloprofundus marisrubri]|uniref:Uncharacterized protein n=1 Tax=Haloprofundus marisrubri TaxID=1514971 RepID=A0A0W1RDV8_9EURY|nr:hypothetical protein AUR64_04140 [Haloprofundus marisrubri]